MAYKIVVPSRRRTANIKRIQQLLPDALICVDEREVSDYAPLVPPDKMLVHPKFDGLPKVRNWVHDNVPEEFIVHIDDDLLHVDCAVSVFGKRHVIKNPHEIRAVIENGVQILEDLGLNAYCWGRCANQVLARPEMKTINFVMPIAGGFIARNLPDRRWDETILSRSDVDYHMRCLLHDRCVICDNRYYFNFGPVFRSAGGNSGLVNDTRRNQDAQAILRRWGRYVSFNASPIARNNPKRGMSDGLSIRVERKSC